MEKIEGKEGKREYRKGRDQRWRGLKREVGERGPGGVKSKALKVVSSFPI